MVQGKGRVIPPLRAAAILAVGLALAACEEKNTYVPPPPPKVTVAKPVTKSITDYMEFTGNVAAVQSVELRARVEGYLEQVLFADGQNVKQGDLLFVIEKAPYVAAVNEAKGELVRAQAAARQTKLTAERRTKAGKTGAVSQNEVDRAVAEADAAAADVTARQAELERAELDLSYTELHAPFDGRIDRRLQDSGNLVGSGEDTILTTINQIHPVYVYFTINEQALRRIQARRDHPDPGTVGQSRSQALLVSFGNEDDDPQEGHLDFAAISLDPDTGTLELRGVFENADRKLMPGMFVTIRAPIGTTEDAILVPQRAVGFDQQGAHVMVVGPDNTVERVGVTQGALDGDLRVIASGLKGDEQVVVKGLLRAIPGREVTPVTQEAAAAPATSQTQ